MKEPIIIDYEKSDSYSIGLSFLDLLSLKPGCDYEPFERVDENKIK